MAIQKNSGPKASLLENLSHDKENGRELRNVKELRNAREFGVSKGASLRLPISQTADHSGTARIRQRRN